MFVGQPCRWARSQLFGKLAGRIPLAVVVRFALPSWRAHLLFAWQLGKVALASERFVALSSLASLL